MSLTGKLYCHILLAVSIVVGASAIAHAKTPSPFDEKEALDYSQAAIGRTVGEFKFLDRNGKTVNLKKFRGKPLIINMIYTSCAYTCPAIIDSLYDGAKIAQDALGSDSFNIVSIGFDAKNDTPSRMRSFANTRGANLPGWRFLSGNQQAIDDLSRTLGFIYFPSPNGFDHLTQTTIVDSQGKVYAHVYGAGFSAPSMVEPLKDLVFGRRTKALSFAGLADRVRLFCTIYDPRNDRYYFDYSIFLWLTISILVLGSIAYVLVRNLWRNWRSGRMA